MKKIVSNAWYQLVLVSITIASTVLVLRQARSAKLNIDPAASEVSSLSKIDEKNGSPGDHLLVNAEGHIVTLPEAQVTVSSEVMGKIRSVFVKEKSYVHQGDLLADVVHDEQDAALAEAKAQLDESTAHVAYFDHELAREQGLREQNVTTPQSLERLQHELSVARAHADMARASVRRLQALIKKSQIVSPIEGVVLNKTVNEGEIVNPGQRLFSVVDLQAIRIEAEVDEFDAAQIALGQTVNISAEGFGHHLWRGKVQEIPDTLSTRQLSPQDPGRPSDTRVLKVKVAFDETSTLKLGQRVEVAIKTSLSTGN